MGFLWPIPIYLAVAAIFAGVARAGRRLFPGTYAARRRFWCPYRSENVDVSFREAAWDGAFVDVSACSAFSPADRVRCDKGCLGLGRLPAARTEAPVHSR